MGVDSNEALAYPNDDGPQYNREESKDSTGTDAYNHFFEYVLTTRDAADREMDRLNLQHEMIAPLVERWTKEFGSDDDDTKTDENNNNEVVWCDLGCGPGHDTALLCRSVANHSKARVIGIDVNQRLLTQAREKYGSLLANVTFLEGSALSIPLDDKSVDRIFIKLVLQHVEGSCLTPIIKEMRRVLKPGGKVFVVDVDEKSGFFVSPEPEHFQELMNQYVEDASQCMNDRIIIRKLPTLFREVGFSRIQIRTDSIVGGIDEDFSVKDVLHVFYNWKINLLLSNHPEDTSKIEKMFSDLRALEDNQDAFVMFPMFLLVAKV